MMTRMRTSRILMMTVGTVVEEGTSEKDICLWCLPRLGELGAAAINRCHWFRAKLPPCCPTARLLRAAQWSPQFHLSSSQPQFSVSIDPTSCCRATFSPWWQRS
jgi:hypothetical protein